MLELPVSELALESLEFLGQESSAGRPQQEAFGQDVEVSRRYAYTGQQVAVCEQIARELSTLGVVIRGEVCRRRQPDDRMTAIGGVNCGSYQVGVLLRVYPATHRIEGYRSVAFVDLSAPYPGEEPTPPLLDAGDEIDCALGD